MGFLRRRGVKRYTGEVEYEPRPDLPWLRNLNFELEACLEPFKAGLRGLVGLHIVVVVVVWIL